MTEFCIIQRNDNTSYNFFHMPYIRMFCISLCKGELGVEGEGDEGVGEGEEGGEQEISDPSESSGFSRTSTLLWRLNRR